MNEYFQTNNDFRTELQMQSELENVLKDMELSDVRREVNISELHTHGLNLENSNWDKLPSWQADFMCRKENGEHILIECKAKQNGIRSALGQGKSYNQIADEVWIVVKSFEPYMLDCIKDEPYHVFFLKDKKLHPLYTPEDDKYANNPEASYLEESILNKLSEVNENTDSNEYDIEYLMDRIYKLKRLEQDKKDRIKNLEEEISHKESKIQRMKEVNSKLKQQVSELEPMGWINERQKLKDRLHKLEQRVEEMDNQSADL